jgi:hypothetical protein
MGILYYGASRLKVEFDDRFLAHLQIVVTSKLRRGESFTINWRDDQKVGNGRSSVWVSPSTDLHFKFSGARVPEINRAWIEALTASAGSVIGLQLIEEGSLAEATHPPQFQAE